MIEQLDELEVITVPEAAAMLGLSLNAVRDAILRGALPARRFGMGTHGLWLTTREDAARYRAEHSEVRRGRPRR
jgi:hypothetical protein